MDVLHITHQFAPETRGGVEAYVLDVAGEQRRRELDARVLCGSHAMWDAAGLEALEVDGLPVHRLHRDDRYFDLYSKAWSPAAEAAIGAFLDEHRPRVVHVHQWIRMAPNLVALARSRGIPTAVTLHDFYSSCPRAFRVRPSGAPCDRELSVESCARCAPRYGHEPDAEIAEGLALFRDGMRAELGSAGAVLVGNAAIAELVGRTLGVPRERFDVLPLGYRPRFAGAPHLAGPAQDEGSPLRFAFWGGVGRHKGVATLVEAFARASGETVRPLELHVLGGFATPEFEAELRAAAVARPRLAVTFHGRFETDDLYAVAPHVGVFPSTCLETHGIVLDECFELGLPCIVGDLGAPASRVGGAGLVVRSGDAEDLARALLRFADEPELWGELAARIPPPPPSLAEHVDLLQARYEATPAGRADAAAIPLERRIAFLQMQRESALATIDPVERHR